MSLGLFDKVYYINLEHRSDRRTSIEKFLTESNIDKDKIRRINAHYNINGALGCAMSHLDALEDAKNNNYEKIVILEDDFVCYDVNRMNNQIRNFFELNIEWDLIMLSANILKYDITKYDNFVKIINAQTTSGYAVNRHFIDNLILVFKNSVNGLKSGGNIETYSIDITWKSLQPSSKWYCFNPKIGYQMDGFSDILKQNISYKC